MPVKWPVSYSSPFLFEHWCSYVSRSNFIGIIAFLLSVCLPPVFVCRIILGGRTRERKKKKKKIGLHMFKLVFILIGSWNSIWTYKRKRRKQEEKNKKKEESWEKVVLWNCIENEGEFRYFQTSFGCFLLILCWVTYLYASVLPVTSYIIIVQRRNIVGFVSEI